MRPIPNPPPNAGISFDPRTGRYYYYWNSRGGDEHYGRGGPPITSSMPPPPSGFPSPNDEQIIPTPSENVPRIGQNQLPNPTPNESMLPNYPGMYRQPDLQNPPPNETPFPYGQDIYRYPDYQNPAPNESGLPYWQGQYNSPTPPPLYTPGMMGNDFWYGTPPWSEPSPLPTPSATPPYEVQLFDPASLYNPPPNEAMMPTPVDTYRPGDLSNPAPNEAMLPTLEDTYYPTTPTSRIPQSRIAQPSQPSIQPAPLLSARPPGTNQDVSAPEWGGWGTPMGYFPYSQNPLGSFGVHGMPSYFGGSQYFNTSPYGGQLVGPGLQPQSVPAPGGMGGIYGVTGDAQLPFGGGHNPYRAALAYGFPNYFAGISGGDITQAGGGRHEGGGSAPTISR